MEEPPNIREIFAAAIEIASDEDRTKYLDKACGGDAALRAEIEGLIQAHRDAGSFFTDGNEGTMGETVATGQKENNAGAQIGPYKLLQQIGEGGMGSVWMAEQEKPVRRMVALKIIKAGMDSKQVIARFEAERQALAIMSHPNIAKVLDAGTTESGRPYFVMELVKGVPITEFCDKNKYTVQQRLELFIDVCRAVQHAHQKGVIHRDIKPSNVMVTLHDGVPVVKVIDFGLAKATSQKLTERTLFTAYGQMVGTPTYMSPEQAEMSGLDVDTRTDVYSLGVLLYELMTGTTPIDARSLRKAGFAEIQRMIQQQEAPPMSTRLSSLGGSSTVIASKRGSDPKRLSQFFRGDLDVIVGKSLDKDRSRRYATPSEFADDVQRFVNNEAIIARPTSTAYRLKKLYQRNRTAVVTTVAVACILVLTTLVSTVQAIRATTAEAVAAKRAIRLRIEQDKTETALQKAEAAELNQRQLREKAEKAAKREQAAAEREKKLRAGAEAAAIREKKQAKREAKLREKAELSERRAKWNTYVARLFPMQQAWKEKNFGRLQQLLEQTTPLEGEPDFRGWEWYYLQNEVDLSANRLSANDPAIQGPVAWHPKQDQFVTGNGSQMEVWDANNFDRVGLIDVGMVPKIAEFSPSGNLLAVGDQTGKVCIVDYKGNSPHQSLAPLPKRKHSWDEALISGLSWSPDERQLAVSNNYSDIAVVDMDDHTVKIIHEPQSKSACRSLDWHPHKPLVAAGLRYGRRTLFDVADNATIEMNPQSLSQGWGTAWSPSGKWLALSDGTQILIADERMSIHRRMDLHEGEVQAVAWLDDDTVLSASIDHTVRVWNRDTGHCASHLKIATSPIWNFAVEPIGSRVLLQTDDEIILADVQADSAQQITTVNTSETRRALPPINEADLSAIAGVESLTWLNDGRHVLSTGSTEIYKHKNGTKTARGFASFWNGFGQEPVMNFAGYLSRGRQWCPPEELLFVGTIGGHFIAYDPITRQFKMQHVIQRTNAEPHFDWDMSRGLGLAVHAEHVLINDIFFSRPVAVSQTFNSGRLGKVRWTPSADYFVTFGWGHTRTLSQVGDLIGKGDLSVFDVDWHPESDVMISALRNGDLTIQDATNLDEIARLEGHRGPVWGVDLSPNGRRIASASSDGTVKIWDFATGQALFSLEVPNVDKFYSVRWSPDGLQLAAGTETGQVVVWGSHSMQPTPTTATEVETGMIRVAAGQRLDAQRVAANDIPRFGWKRYVDQITRMLQWHEKGFSVDRINENFNRLKNEAIANSEETEENRQDDLTTAMIHLLNADVSPEAVDWLATHLIQKIESDIATSPTPANGFRQLAETHIHLAHLKGANADTEEHWQKAANASMEVIKRDPDDQVAFRRLEFIVNEHLDAPQLAAFIYKQSWKRFYDPLQSMLNDLQEGGDAEVVGEAWSIAHRSVLQEEQPAKSQRQFARAMMESLGNDLTLRQKSWLARKLLQSLRIELEKQPNNEEVLDDLAQSHLVLAELAEKIDGEGRVSKHSHLREACTALLKLVELNPGNQLALTQLKLVIKQLPVHDPEVEPYIEKGLRRALAEAPGNVQIASLLSEFLLHQSPDWASVTPVDCRSVGGATMSIREDGAILAGGENPRNDEYELELKTSITSIGAIKLIALTDLSLPNSGPGRDARGRFTLLGPEIEVASLSEDDAPQPVILAEANADTYYEPYPINPQRWIVHRSGAPAFAIYRLAKPVRNNSGFRIYCRMRFSDKGSHWRCKNLGCFRLFASETADSFHDERQRLAAKQIIDPWARLAAAYYIADDHRSLEKLVDERPTSQAGLAAIAAVRKDWDTALSAYDAVLEETPDNPDVLSDRADVFMQLKRWEEAKADLSVAVELDVDNHDRRLDFARFLMQQGDWEAAAAHMRIVAERDSDRAGNPVFLGDVVQAHTAAQLHDLAAHFVTRYLENLDPNLLKQESEKVVYIHVCAPNLVTPKNRRQLIAAAERVEESDAELGRRLRAAIEFRLGHIGESIRLFGEESGPGVELGFIAAMAHHDAGNAEIAERHRRSPVSWMERYQSELAEGRSSWQKWAKLTALQQEAEERMANSPL